MENLFNLTDLAKAIEHVAGTILDFALVLAAVGTVAMASLELFKSLFFLRRIYHRVMVKRWLCRDDDALDQLLVLAAGGKGNGNILFDQPTEKMLAQIQAAANVALDYPVVYPHLYEFLARGSAMRRFKNVDMTDQERWQKFFDQRTTTAATEAPTNEAREASQAHSRLSNLVTRKLDAFQTYVEYWWARVNQLVAIMLGAAFFWYTIHQTKTAAIAAVSDATLVVFSIMAGLLSPFAKDVVTALTGLRARR